MSFFTVVFYGVKIFCCKTAQLSVTQRECGMAKTPNVSNCVQHCENRRKNSLLNYKSAALDQLSYAGKNAPELSVES